MSLEELKAEAFKAYQTKQYDLAVELFGSACGTYAAAHDGQEDPDLLFEYGNALFSLGRANASLLNTENVDSTSRPMARELDPSIELAPLEVLPADQQGDQPEADKPEDEKKTSEAEDTPKPSDEAEAEPEVPAAADADDEPEPTGDDDADEFTAAWQMIDLCRVLYTRQLETAKDKGPLERKLADVYALLGDISIEDDNYDQAAEDFASALELKKQIYDPANRLLSEAHYMLALALEMKGDSDKEQALENMKAAVEVAKKAGVDSQSIQDLRQKVHDLKRDIEALKAAPAPAPDRSDALKGMMDMLGGAQDIGGLVKRKKKVQPQPAKEPAEQPAEQPAEESAEQVEPEAKKSKLE